MDRLARLRLLIVILTVVPVAISLMMSAVPTTSAVSAATTPGATLAGAPHITPADHERSPDHRHKLPGGVPLATTQAAEADDQPVDWVPGAAGVVTFLPLDLLLGAVTNRAPPVARAAIERTRAELQVWRA